MRVAGQGVKPRVCELGGWPHCAVDHVSRERLNREFCRLWQQGAVL